MIDTTELKRRAGLMPYQSRLRLTKTGANKFKAQCPFHSDSNPSLEISLKDGEYLYHCFPCKDGGDVIKFVEKKDNLAFRDAVKTIADESNIKLEEEEASGKSVTPHAKYYASAAQARLSEAEAFLTKRGISMDVAKNHRLGVVDFFPLGKSVSLPYNDEVTKVRALVPTVKGEKFRHYPGRGSAELLYNLETIDSLEFAIRPEVFVVESELDALLMESNGYNAVSVSSASACIGKDGNLKFSPEQMAKLEQADRIYLMLDMDEPGQACAAAFKKALPKYKVRHITWPYKGKGSDSPKDVGELYAKNPSGFKELIQRLVDESNIPLLWRQAAAFSTLPQKKYEWVCDELIPKDDVTLLTGDFGSFKSFTSYFLADSMSAGKSFVGRKCQKHPVLILDRENSHSTVFLRRTLVGDLKNRDNVRILGLFTDPGACEITDPRLLEVCEMVKPVVIIDSLTDFHSGLEENSADDMTLIFSQIRALITAGAVSVIILHHIPKGGSGNSGRYRGSTAIAAATANAIFIEKTSKNRVRLTGFKNRSGENAEIELQINFPKVNLEGEMPDNGSVSYQVLNSGMDPAAQLQSEIENHLAENEGCTTADISEGLGRRKQDVVDALAYMERSGVIVRTKAKSQAGRPRETFYIRQPDLPDAYLVN